MTSREEGFYRLCSTLTEKFVAGGTQTLGYAVFQYDKLDFQDQEWKLIEVKKK